MRHLHITAQAARRPAPLILLLLLWLLLWLLPPPLHANEAFAREIAEMRTLYLDVAESQDKRDLRKAIKHVNALARRYPDHPLVMVYQGCTLAERGRDEGERPLNRMRDTEEGLRQVDRGLRLLQQRDLHFFDAAEARLMAAFLFIHLPDSVFHRLREGSHLVEGLLAEPRFDEMPAPLRAGIYYAAAIVAEKNSDKEQQRRYLELTLKANPEGRSAQKARALLEQLAG